MGKSLEDLWKGFCPERLQKNPFAKKKEEEEDETPWTSAMEQKGSALERRRPAKTSRIVDREKADKPSSPTARASKSIEAEERGDEFQQGEQEGRGDVASSKMSVESGDDSEDFAVVYEFRVVDSTTQATGDFILSKSAPFDVSFDRPALVRTLSLKRVEPEKSGDRSRRSCAAIRVRGRLLDGSFQKLREPIPMPLDDEPVLRVEQAELNAWAKARKLTALQFETIGWTAEPSSREKWQFTLEARPLQLKVIVGPLSKVEPLSIASSPLTIITKAKEVAKELYSRQSPSKAMEELGYRMITATRRGEAGVTEELIQNMLTSDVGDSLEIRATVKPKFDNSTKRPITERSVSSPSKESENSSSKSLSRKRPAENASGVSWPPKSKPRVNSDHEQNNVVQQSTPEWPPRSAAAKNASASSSTNAYQQRLPRAFDSRDQTEQRQTAENSPSVENKRGGDSVAEETPPFKGIVAVISGIQNPERAQLRDMIIGLGGRYEGQWSSRCNLLVSAFGNTPKFNEAKKDGGTIVRKNYIEECAEANKRLPVLMKHRFPNDGKPASRDEQSSPQKTTRSSPTKSKRDGRRDETREGKKLMKKRYTLLNSFFSQKGLSLDFLFRSEVFHKDLEVFEAHLNESADLEHVEAAGGIKSVARRGVTDSFEYLLEIIKDATEKEGKGKNLVTVIEALRTFDNAHDCPPTASTALLTALEGYDKVKDVISGHKGSESELELGLFREVIDLLKELKAVASS